MGQNTAIEWCDATWSPVRGCTRTSEGCRFCYSERMAARNLPAFRSPTTGEPFAIMQHGEPHWTGRMELIESQLEIPLHWRKPRRIFVNSMSDTFHEDLPDEDIDRIFNACHYAPQHTYLFLTKRAKRMHKFLSDRWSAEMIPRNWWLGVSVEDRKNKDRIDVLRETPAALRFLSLEPLLEDLGELDLRGIGLVIVGGESGPGARPMHPDWVRALRDQCVKVGARFHLKQLGEWREEIPGDITSNARRTVIPAAPGYRAVKMIRVGKKAAGRLLDGRTWDEFPESAK